jgi:hypothetical protein
MVRRNPVSSLAGASSPTRDCVSQGWFSDYISRPPATLKALRELRVLLVIVFHKVGSRTI